MEGYPQTPAEIVLERIAKNMGVSEPLPPLREFFAAGLRISKKKVDEFTTTNAPDVLGGSAKCQEQIALSLFKEMGFEQAESFFAKAYEEIKFYSRRQQEMGPAIHAMRHFPRAIANGDNSQDIHIPEIAKGVEKSGSAVSSYIQMRKIPPIETTNKLVTFFQAKIGALVANTPLLEAPQSGDWDETDFYNIAQKMALLYPKYCEKPMSAKASPAVVEWAHCLDALIKVLGMLESDFEKNTGVTKTTVNSYRRAKTASGPNLTAKKELQEALGCESDDQFLECGRAAQAICQLRKQAIEHKIFTKFRTEILKMTMEKVEEIYGLPVSTQASYEAQRRIISDPESFITRLGFRAPEDITRALQTYIKQISQADYAVESFRLRVENLPAEFYFYQTMGLEPNPKDFSAIAELRKNMKAPNTKQHGR